MKADAWPLAAVDAELRAELSTASSPTAAELLTNEAVSPRGIR